MLACLYICDQACYLLSVCHQLALASATDWFINGHAMCYHVHVKMHVENL